MLLVVIAVLIGAFAVVTAVLLARGYRVTPVGRGFPVDVGAGRRAVLRLEIGAVDPRSDAVARLLDDAAGRVFAHFPDVDEVEVRSTEGSVLGVRRRHGEHPVAIPGTLHEPHPPPHRVPDVGSVLADDRSVGTPGWSETTPAAHASDAGSLAPPHRPLADRFELPAPVRARIDDPDDPVSIVRALLEEAGLAPAVHADVLRVGDDAVVVVRAGIGEPVPAEALNRAYLRFRESGARRGVVVTPGFVPPHDVRRRESFDASLLHAGPDGIQRMADAVAIGANPLRFAAAPPLASG